MHDAYRPAFRRALRTLQDAARAERARVSLHSPEHAFYLGVGAAATETLKPELGMARATDWLDREEPSFREGYLRASTVIATAALADPPPARLAMPRARSTA